MVRQSLRTLLVSIFALSAVVLGLIIISATQAAVGPRAHELFVMITALEIIAFLVSAIGLAFLAFGNDRTVSVAALIHALALFGLAAFGNVPPAIPLLLGLIEIVASYILIEHAEIEKHILG